MPKSDEFPREGDVLVSEAFAFGYYNDEDRQHIVVDGKTRHHVVSYYLSEDERVALAAKAEAEPPKTREVDLGVYDRSRGEARFVVEQARLEGGDQGHGPGDIYPDGWHIAARRLWRDGSYADDGEVIKFYLSGCFTNQLRPEQVAVVGRMKKQYVMEG